MPDPAPTPPRHAGFVPAIAVVAVFSASALALVWMGRVWWCACGRASLWNGNVWCSHCSQHLLDPYSLSHTSHGLVFSLVLVALARTPAAPFVRATARWHTVIAALLAGAWEVLENTPLVIERYRSSTMSLDYLGDSVVNSLGDMVCCVFAFVLARRAGAVWTLFVFVASELILLWWIRDNLTLNVVMLLWPIKAIREWQVVGAPAPA